MAEADNTIAIIGGGAAGLMAAAHAAGPGRQVLMIDRNHDTGRKILISGGGRCNVLPSKVDPSRYVTASSPNSLRKILTSWSLDDQRRFFEDEVELPLRLEPETGKLFPVADRSRAVRDALHRTVLTRGVRHIADAEVRGLEQMGDNWEIALDDGHSIRARAVIVATGGLSVPQTGSDGFGFRALARLGHTINPTYPALTPLTISPPRYEELAGVSLTASVTARSEAETRTATDGFLFTHRGYSGPALLDVSHVCVRGRLAGLSAATVTVAWEGMDAADWLRELGAPARNVGTVIRRLLPTRLADRIILESGVDPDIRTAQLRREQRDRLVTLLTAYPLPWSSDEGYRKAEVTGGGVALGEVQPGSLESRITGMGLFLAGELLDAFGPIGGYNFLWAWTTGRLAGLGAARYVG